MLQYEILTQPTYALLEVHLNPGDSVVAEAGAMAWMSANVKTQTTTRGGLLKGLKRAVLGGESFFQNTYTVEDEPGTVGLAPGCPGDIVAYELSGGELFMERGAYLASDATVTVDSKWQGFSGLFKEGLFALRVTGRGTVFFCSYGRIEEINVQGEYLVDNGFAVAWEPSLQYRITKAKKIRSFLFSDQLLMRFSGHGRLWVQSRTPHSLANWINPFRPAQSS
jgi:uncharacterized protein (TIGR00266 family)